MKINLGAITDISTIDWPGKVSSIIFLNGCNMKCWYCHNKQFLNKENFVEIKSIVEEIKNNKFIDSIIISGGEPTLQENLYYLCKDLKVIELPIGIETNGTNSTLLKKLIEDKLIDKIFLDIKTKPSKYEELTGIKWKVIEKSLFLKNIEIETRTTIFSNVEIPYMKWRQGKHILQKGI